MSEKSVRELCYDIASDITPDEAGVYANLWTVRADRASNWDKDAEVQVFVSDIDRRIVIRVAIG